LVFHQGKLVGEGRTKNCSKPVRTIKSS
jgi:hypothetical protein